jgi:hypothetical protein
MDYILGAHIALAGSLTGIMFILTRRAPVLLILPKSEDGLKREEGRFLSLKQPHLVIRKKISSSRDSIKWLLGTKKREGNHLQKDYWKKFLREFKK